MFTHQIKILSILPIFGIAFALFAVGALFVRPAFAADPVVIACPANGDGPEDLLKDAIVGLNKVPSYDTIVISVAPGSECLFTLTTPITNPTTGPAGLPLISHDVVIRALGGRAVIERDPSAPLFRLLESDGNLTLENLTFRNGDGEFTNYDFPTKGGAILAHMSLTMTNVIITNNISYRGGGVYVAGPLVMDHVVAEHNTTLSADPSDGGAIFVGGNLSATNITMTHNSATDCGCGGHKARGGAIFVGGNALISKANFEDNLVNVQQGGGLYVTGALTMTGSSFISNTAGLQGGGLFAEGPLKLSESDFISNFAKFDGGGLFINGAASVTSSRYISNTAGGQGGGIAAGANQNVVVQASTFVSNVAAAGGGLMFQGGLLQGNLFKSNRVTGAVPIFGGGAVMVALQATIENNRFYSNTAPMGGALQILYYPLEGSSADSLVANNLFVDNKATANNGAAIAAGISLDLFQGDFVMVTHNTIVQHQRDNGAAFYFAKSSADVSNNIISQQRIGIQTSDAGVTSNANLFNGTVVNYVGIMGGPKDMTADPLFVDATHENYHLQPSSPARDSGVDLGVKSDFDGVSRPQGKGFDRGAFEYVNHAPVAHSENYTTAIDTPLVVAAPGLLANANDPDGDVLTVTAAFAPAHGALSLQPSGAFIYTPTALFSGTESFGYRASDGIALSAVTTVTIVVEEGETSQAVAITGLKGTNDAPALVGRTIHFVATVDTGSDVQFTWDFGDKSTAGGPKAGHSYNQPGEYQVKLTAANRLGVKQTTLSLRVKSQDQQEQQQLSLPLVSK